MKALGNATYVHRALKEIWDRHIARWYCVPCRIRADDVLFGSFPKSGRTWVRFFVGSYLAGVYGTRPLPDWSTFSMMAPGYRCSELREFDLTISSRPIFSHEPQFARYFRNKRVVYIARSFLDIVVSYYHYHSNRSKQEWRNLELEEFFENVFPLDRSVRAINRFSAALTQANDRLIIRYEDLLASPADTFEAIVRFARWPWDSSAFHAALDHSAFDSMRRLEEESRAPAIDDARFVRKASPGRELACLDSEVKNRLVTVLSEKLKEPLRDYYLPMSWRPENA